VCAASLFATACAAPSPASTPAPSPLPPPTPTQDLVERGDSLTVAGDKVFFGANDGRLYCLGTEAGEYIWSRNLGSPILGDVLIEVHDMYVSDYAGNLYRFDISSILKIRHSAQGVSNSRKRYEN
jgi:hypothetical protein